MSSNDDLIVRIGTELDTSGVEKDVKKLIDKLQKTTPKYIKRISGTNKGIITSTVEGQWYSFISELTQKGSVSKRKGGIKKIATGSEENIRKLSNYSSIEIWDNNVRLQQIREEKREEKQITSEQEKQQKIREKELETESKLKELKSLQAQKEYLAGNEKARQQTLQDAKAYFNELEKEISKRKEKQSLALFAEDDAKSKANRKKMLQDAKAYFGELYGDKGKAKKRVSGIEKLFNTIKRVGFYRIARNIFRYLESGISDAMKTLANVSPEANKMLSQLTGNIKVLGTSLGVAIYPLLKLIEPILQRITEIVGNLATGISYLAYKLGITSSWFKINTKYMKEFNQESNKFSFDKFEALTGADDSSDIITEMFGEDTEGTATKYANIIQNLIVALGALGITKLVTWLIDGGPKKVLDNLKDSTKSLTSIKDKIIDIGASLAFMFAVYEIAKNLRDLIDNWDAKSLADKIKGILKIAMYGIGAILIALGAIPGIGTALKVAGIGLIAVTAVMDGIGLFANGGMVDSGSLFIAGEAGAELVTTMPSGQTGVTNVAQFKQAMLEALYEWSDSQSGGGDVILNLDGAEVARSKRFVGELNRKNSGLNLR